MDDPTLFPADSPPPPARVVGPFAAVAIERSLDRVLDYSIPRGLVSSIRVGQRVRVPLGRGNKATAGYVVEIRDTSQTTARIKAILAIDDARVLLTPSLIELSRWISRYYCCPLGTVLESVIPAAVKKKVGMEYSQMVRLAMPREEIQAILEKCRAPKRRAILARLLQIEPEGAVELGRLAGEAGATAATVRKLGKLGVVAITAQATGVGEERPGGKLPVASCQLPEAPAGNSQLATGNFLPLNEDQQKAFDELLPRLAGGFSVNLIHGVTGSGKTEIYLRCIREVVAQGRRAIVLVPEIALTPQTVERFTARFSRVAILHSGLVASARHRFWQQIAQGQADVVVGARSAVFAPVSELGIIVVDEEHESSYKQDTAPRYHARDLAIKRAQIENVPILLGSATPSLEMWHRTQLPVAAGGGGGYAARGDYAAAGDSSDFQAAGGAVANDGGGRAPGDIAFEPPRLFEFRVLPELPARDAVQVLRCDGDVPPLGRGGRHQRAL
jgi:primosomal protein N' (replication factor Y)